ncbi:acetolactate synthase large subunit [Sinirhodobacter populi]|uniref:Acetolactate synthase large subunit n=1 Tax=Paenirhodobacter populi TaxID=2306993 RepID=A0A443K6K8_9RHOB|nr:acetolactate synthase large subunit [Sinirhodobacter populi]RWR28380.1 acetolactate synthase large subunit [Sinirhodobacter populi]
MNGADRLCDALLVNGIDVCFANPGTSEMHFVAALDHKPELRCILGLQENVVTGAADGYARMADRPAATLLHLGPGLANGLANIHNARRARTPMVNIVGNHATYHRKYEAPLSSDVEGVARPMSDWVASLESAAEISAGVNAAVAAAASMPGVATLILPADTAWEEVAPADPVPATIPAPPGGDPAAISGILEAIEDGLKVALLLDGAALRAGPLETAGRIAAHCGVRLLTPTSVARIERGAGRVAPDRIPYRIEAAEEAMKDVDVLVLVGAQAPVAFFAYPGRPSVPTRPDTRIVPYAAPGADAASAMTVLADALGAASVPAPVCVAGLPPRPGDGTLTGPAVTAMVARTLPENAIVVDESITQGYMFESQSRGCPHHDMLDLTGGAIGIGLPLSIGAAVACPDRKVICLQADGSGLYTVQALWTQAREGLDILTVVFSNGTYATLHGEMKRVGVDAFGVNAGRMVNLDAPRVDWVTLARSFGVDAARATTVAELEPLLETALMRPGPFLIEACI